MKKLIFISLLVSNAFSIIEYKPNFPIKQNLSGFSINLSHANWYPNNKEWRESAPTELWGYLSYYSKNNYTIDDYYANRYNRSYSGNVKYGIGVDNGTNAIGLGLRALGIKSGDEVITVPYTWISSAEVIALCGAKPVFVDIRSDTFNLDETLLEAAITEKTKAI